VCVCIMAPQHKFTNCKICRLDSASKSKYFKSSLLRILKSSSKRRQKYLNKANDCFIHYMSDCCLGILTQAIHLPKHVYHKLGEYKRDIVYLVQKYPSIRHKRERLIKQSGGFLSILLPALASSLFGLVTNLISKKISK